MHQFQCLGSRDRGHVEFACRKGITVATTMYRDMDMTHWLDQAEAEIQSPYLR
jgi:hypothetical protein